MISFDITLENVFFVPERRSKQERTCQGSMPYSQEGPVKEKEEDRLKAATERLQR